MRHPADRCRRRAGAAALAAVLLSAAAVAPAADRRPATESQAPVERPLKAKPKPVSLAEVTARARRAQPLTLYLPTAWPQALPVRQATDVKFTVLLAGGAVKSRPEVSLQIRGLGRSVPMHDDGRIPDLSAGDRIYSALVRFTAADARAGRCYDVRARTRSGARNVLSGERRVCASRFPAAIAASDLRPSNIIVFTQGKDTGRVLADEALIRVRRGVSDSQIAAAAAAVGGRVVGSLPAQALYQIRLPKPQTAQGLRQTVLKLQGAKGVELAGPHPIAELQTPPVNPVGTNDPMLGQQWALDRIRANQAWAISTGDPAQLIAIIDTGADFDHPDFWTTTPSVATRFATDGSGNILAFDCASGSCAPVSKPTTCYQNTTNPCNNNNAATDLYGHGTLLAGFPGAAVNNTLGTANVGIAGATWQNRLLIMRYAAGNNGTAGSLAQAIAKAATEGARILSISTANPNTFYGNITCPEVVNAENAGRLVVSAAGNDGTNTTFNYPAACTTQTPPLSTPPTGTPVGMPVANSEVSASGQDVIRTASPNPSNYSTWIHIAAPGGENQTLTTTDKAVVSTARTPSACTTCDPAYTSTSGYKTVIGTSFSAPLAAGAAALVLARSPSMTVADLRTLLTSTGVALQPPAAHINRINVLAALLALNTAPTAVNLSGLCIAENTNTTTPVSVGTLTTVDADVGSTGHEYSVFGGADAGKFSIGGANGDQLMIKDGFLDFETKASYAVTVRTTDVGNATFNQPLIVSVCDVNEAPTAVTLSNTVTSTPENGPAVKVADIAITDDALGTNVLSRSGPDAASFSIVGTELRFNGGANFEVKNSYSVTVNVDDATVGGAPDASQNFTLAITNVNEAPTATNLSAPETYTEDVALNLTDIVVSDVDSATVTATLTLSNPAAGSLSTATSGAVTSTYAAGVWTASGALADVNVLLAGVVFTPASNFNGNFTIATSVSDGVAAAITGSKAMTGTAVNDAPTGLPTISGIPTEDQTLTANTSAIADADGLGAFSYQWLRGGVNIPGATGSTYVLGDDDVGQLISVRVSYTDGQGTPESLTSAPTAAIANINDAPTGFPTISGTLTVGQILTAITSAIADADGLGPFSYQWMRGVADIPGKTGSTYELVQADFGTIANVRVSYTDGHDFPESLTTVNATNTGDPHITTVDGLHYDFQAAGEFVTLRGANGMEIQTRQTPVSTAAPIADSHSGLSVGVSINTAVAARVGTHRVTLQPNISGLAAASGLELRVDGVLTTLPANGINFGSGARVVPLPGGAIQVDFPDGTTMIVTPGFWTSHNVWYLNVSVFHTSAREGIMGARYQGSWLPRLADGTSLGARPAALHDRYVELYEKFANSWRVKKETSLFDYAQGTSTETFTLASWPPENPPFVVPQGGRVTKPINRQIARQQCRAVAGKNQNADCVFDVMVTGNPGFARTYLLEQKIQGGLTSTVVRDDKATAKPNEPVMFTATVVKSAVVTGVVQRSVDRKSQPRGQVIPTGTVQFTLDGKNVGKPVRLDAKGQARVKMSRTQLGTRQLAARYLPARGSVFLASRSLEEPRKVTKHKD